MGRACDRAHLLDANLALAAEGVTIQTGAARRSAVVEVDEPRQSRMGGEEALQVGQRIVAAGEDVTRVDADAEARVVDLCDEAGELFPRAKDLSALARGSLQKERTGLRSVGQRSNRVGAHGGHRSGHLLLRGLADVDDDAAGADGRTVLKALDEELGVEAVVVRRFRSTEVDDVGAVDVDGAACLGYRGRRRG